MYDELIKLINICLADNELSEKERTVIFNKAKQLGISDEECEVVIDSMIAKATNKSAKSEMRQSDSFTPKTITKISPPELNQTETLENEKQQNRQNIQQLEIQLADIQQNFSRLKEEKELLEANYAESYKKAFYKLNDNALWYVEAELTAKTKSKVILTDRNLNYDEFTHIDSKEELSGSFCKLLYERKWEMPDYKAKLLSSQKIFSFFSKISIPSLFLFVVWGFNYSEKIFHDYSGGYSESQASADSFKSIITLIFLVGIVVIVMLFKYLKKINMKLEKPISFKNSDISYSVSNYFYNKIDIELYLELAKSYKLIQKK